METVSEVLISIVGSYISCDILQRTKMAFCLALAIGIMAGLRSMITPAIVCWAVRLKWLDLHTTVLAVLGSAAPTAAFSMLAIGELVADKLPSAPNRTAVGPLLVRLLTGSFCGVTVCLGACQSIIAGGLLGGLGALAGAFGGYQIRHRVVNRLNHSLLVALVEDAIAIGGSLYLLSRV
jgi:uncharacterized membrane protein